MIDTEIDSINRMELKKAELEREENIVMMSLALNRLRHLYIGMCGWQLGIGFI